jgi:hypothetical protein
MLVLVSQTMYLAAMTMARVKLKRMLIATIRAERENDAGARRDELTGLANRSGLVARSRSGCPGPAPRTRPWRCSGSVLAMAYPGEPAPSNRTG